jgi:hypothetical protein
MDRIINLLRCSYKSLEIELEETVKPAAIVKVKPSKQISVNTSMVTNGYTSSSSSDGQSGPSTQSKQKRHKKTKSSPKSSSLTVGVVAATPATATSQSVQPSSSQSSKSSSQTTPPSFPFAGNARTSPMVLAPNWDATRDAETACAQSSTRYQQTPFVKSASELTSLEGYRPASSAVD